MAIIKAPPKQPKSVTIQARVEESVKIQLDLYAQFIASTPSYVISEALKWHGKLGDPKTEDSIRVVELSPQASEHLKTSLKSWRPNEAPTAVCDAHRKAMGSERASQKEVRAVTKGTGHPSAAR